MVDRLKRILSVCETGAVKSEYYSQAVWAVRGEVRDFLLNYRGNQSHDLMRRKLCEVIEAEMKNHNTVHQFTALRSTSRVFAQIVSEILNNTAEMFPQA